MQFRIKKKIFFISNAPPGLWLRSAICLEEGRVKERVRYLKPSHLLTASTKIVNDPFPVMWRLLFSRTLLCAEISQMEDITGADITQFFILTIFFFVKSVLLWYENVFHPVGFIILFILMNFRKVLFIKNNFNKST